MSTTMTSSTGSLTVSTTPVVSRDPSTIKPPKPPERPLVPYMRYSRKMWATVRAENPDAQLWDIGRRIGQLWRELSDTEKAVFQEEYDGEKAEYDKILKQYHNSPAYQAYLAAKNRAKMQDKGVAAVSAISPLTGTPVAGRNAAAVAHRPSGNRMEASGVVIQPVDEQDGDAQLNMRQLAAVRFQRNHRLIADLFSGAVVPDTRTVVVEQRVQTLKKQAKSLADHQTKLENDLGEIESAFQAKKRSIETSGNEFNEQLKRVCEEKPNVDEKKFNELVEKAAIELAYAFERYKKQHETVQAREETLAGKTPVLYQLTVPEPAESHKTTNGHAATNGSSSDGQLLEEKESSKEKTQVAEA